jgi:hypothetical protein
MKRLFAFATVLLLAAFADLSPLSYRIRTRTYRWPHRELRPVHPRNSLPKFLAKNPIQLLPSLKSPDDYIPFSQIM